MIKRQIYCGHCKEQAKKTAVYTYGIIDIDLNLCKKCERKLRKVLLEQVKIEKWCDGRNKNES